MAQKNRSKELWLIPKRVNLHQTICLIDGIIERDYSGTAWNEAKQNNLGVNLKKWGATNDGKNISQQGVRTLTASIPQYLGFLYINTKTTPSSIVLTKAGERLWESHKNDLIKIKNLREGKDLLVSESSVLLEQMEKLIITNPIVLKDCEDILVFPFRLTLKLLIELNYLDREELAYIVFKTQDESELDLTVEEIKNFRRLDFNERERLINLFKKTHLGNITLVKAPSAGYYETLCQLTGIVSKLKIVKPNPGNVENSGVAAIKLKEKYVDYVKGILDNKYVHAEIFDFKDDLDLWIDYIGTPERVNPPQYITLKNDHNVDVLICIKKDGRLLDGDLVSRKDEMQFPMFFDEEYVIECIDIITGNVLSSSVYIPKFNKRVYKIVVDDSVISEEVNVDFLVNEILQHSSSSNFSKKMIDYLLILTMIDGKDRTSNKNLRGAYYEYLFYQLLIELLEIGVIDDIVWNGKIGKFGLPTPAPGGKMGTPDMVFTINGIDYVLELTTMRPKSSQFSSEGASVPDHVRLHRSQTKKSVVGIFCAPTIHKRNTAIMQASLKSDGIILHCVEDSDFLEILKKKNRDELINYLK